MLRTQTYSNYGLETDLARNQLFSAETIIEVHQDEPDIVFTIKLLHKNQLGTPPLTFALS
jgi:hypothetical protein